MLDRLIILTVTTTSRNQYGEAVESSSDHRVWATRTDQSLEEMTEEGGDRDEGRRDWRIRWSSLFAGMQPSALSVTENGLTWNVINIIEVPDMRRRFLDLQGVRST